METRIYVVEDGDVVRLVNAASKSQAIAHCAKGRYAARAAKVKEVAEAMGDGVEVEQVKADPEPGRQ